MDPRLVLDPSALTREELLSCVLGGPVPAGLAGLDERSLFDLARAQEGGGGILEPLLASQELVRRRSLLAAPPRPRLDHTLAVSRHVRPRLLCEPVEVFLVLLLDVRLRLVGEVVISRGTVSASLVHPREVFRPAVLRGASSVVVVHNHPSGDPEPSPEDEAVTARLCESGSLLGIPVLDHVIMAEGGEVSFAERGRVPAVRSFDARAASRGVASADRIEGVRESGAMDPARTAVCAEATRRRICP